MTETPHSPVASLHRPVRVLSIWHGAVRLLNRERYDALARYPDIRLTLLAPRRWAAAMPRELRFERDPAPPAYRTIVERAWLRSHAAFHFYPRLFSILEETEPDLIDLYEEPYTFLAWLIAWWRNQYSPTTRFVFTACQNIGKRYPPPFRWMERYVLESADGAMALDEGAREVFRAKGYDGPFEVVPTGIDTEKFRRIDATYLRRTLALERPTVGYIGRMIEEKGVDTLLEAAALGPGTFDLLLVGDGPEKAALQARARDLGIERRVVWIGAVLSDEIVRYLSCMDVFVLPSRTRPHWKEQLGRVLVEAMACDVAVIGSKSGAIPNVIGDAGMLFEEGHAARLREEIDLVVESVNLRKEMIRRGRRRVETHYSWQAIARKTRQLWFAAFERPSLEIRRRK